MKKELLDNNMSKIYIFRTLTSKEILSKVLKDKTYKNNKLNNVSRTKTGKRLREISSNKIFKY